jgi:hypothetical protein
MNKKAKFSYGGLNQDISKSKHPLQFYYDAKNIRIVNTTDQSGNSIINEKGNLFILEIPTITIDSSTNSINYNSKKLPFVNKLDNELLNSTLPVSSNSQKILGHAITRDSIILITSDSNKFDCIWEIKELYEGVFDLELLYCRDLNLNINSPVQILFNYENEKIQKIYWVDGSNQLRFVNIKHSITNGDLENLIDLNSNLLNIVGNYKLSEPSLISVAGGGIHTSGIIQYSYNLYKLNGSQTTISPLSELILLDKGSTLGGGDVNEIVGSTPLVSINSIDSNYTHIKIYAIKYTSFNEIPSISLIIDEQIDSFTNYTFSDTGSKINDISLSEFIFLGSNPITPKHIESKDSRLFVSNYKETAYDLNIDARAYSHTNTGISKLYTGNITYINNQIGGNYDLYPNSIPISNYNYNIKADAINPDYDTYKYHKNGITVGGEGLFMSYTLLQKTGLELTGNTKYLRFLKDGEIYRIGIQFYNKLGQKTDVKWVADFKTPTGNLEGNYNILKVDIKSTEFNSYITSLNLEDNNKPVGYKIVRAQRDIKDMTILCQGSLTGMMVQTTQDSGNPDFWEKQHNREDQSIQEVKLPQLLTRGFTMPSTEESIYHTSHLKPMSEDNKPNTSEIYKDGRSSNYHNQNSWQYTKMMQFHSPDILFNTGLVFGNGLKLKIKGLVGHTESNYRYQRINIESKAVLDNDPYTNITNLRPSRKPGTFGVIGPNYDGCDDNTTDFLAYNRKYNTFINGNNSSYNIFGSPEITERGQGVKSYNGNSNYNYTNSFESIISDAHKGVSSGGDDEAIRGVNSYGEKCVTMVLGNDNQDEKDRPTLESIASSQGTLSNSLLLTELTRVASYIYTGNLYGGLSNEDKTRTTYIEIGSYKNITEYSNEIENCGDIYVQNYIFGRVLKTDTEVYSCKKMQLTEIVEHPIETTVNLQNRSDLSLLGWDNKFQPRYDEFHNYNRVYSQSSNLINNQTDNIKLKKVSEYNSRIISSKLKIPGEFIDSWTDFLENETLDLDGKYGSINNIITFNDVLYALQDRAVSKIGVNPRVQTQGSDGLSIELGTGGILYDYNYITTDSGTLNKWSVFTSPYGFYYFDLLNKSYNKFNGKILNLSSMKGMHAYFQNNTDYTELIKDNHLLRQGIIGGYDSVNKEALLTLLQGDKSFTLGFNDKKDYFTSFYDYLPSIYINRGFRNLMVNPSNNKLYNSFEGEYNKFFDVKYPSYITLMINPESDLDCIFDNIEYNSEVYINDIDMPTETLSHIQGWNEYQDSGRIPLVVGRSSNLRRKFRKWRADIPRDGRKRLRNPWIFLKLELDTTNNSKFILHDIIINYTV